MKYFDSSTVSQAFRRLIKMLAYLLLTVLIGIVIGFMVSGQNPLKVFYPTTWIHIFEFLS